MIADNKHKYFDRKKQFTSKTFNNVGKQKFGEFSWQMEICYPKIHLPL